MTDSISFQKVKTGSPQETVLNRLDSVAASDREQTKVLDIPTGGGIVAFPLSVSGFDVTGCDLFPEDALETVSKLSKDGSKGSGKINVLRGDMAKALPFADDSFDVIVSVEGIEHICEQESFIQEMRRLLKSGGRIIITTPNILCLRSRMAYALTGQRTLKTFIDEYMAVQARENERVYHGHVFLSSYFELRYILHNNHFRIKEVLSSRCSPTSVLLAPFMLPFVALFTFLAARRWKKKFLKCSDQNRIPAGAQPPYREIVRHVLSRAVLFSGSLVIEAEAV